MFIGGDGGASMPMPPINRDTYRVEKSAWPRTTENTSDAYRGRCKQSSSSTETTCDGQALTNVSLSMGCSKGLSTSRDP